MFMLLRNGCPAPACRHCRRFTDDPRGMHSDTCSLGPKGVSRPEHGWRNAMLMEAVKQALPKAPDMFEQCPKKWAYPQGETLLDKLKERLDPEAIKKALEEGDSKVNPCAEVPLHNSWRKIVSSQGRGYLWLENSGFFILTKEGKHHIYIGLLWGAPHSGYDIWPQASKKFWHLSASKDTAVWGGFDDLPTAKKYVECKFDINVLARP